MRHATFCRICPATCGLVVDVEDNRVVRSVGDVDNALTRGFSCPKGRHIGDFLAAPDRHLTSLRKNADGVHEPIEVSVAIEEIATRLREIGDEHGADSIGFFGGTQAAFSSLTGMFSRGWSRTTESRKSFSTMTIDQSAVWVADGRMGSWSAGHPRFEDADVWLIAGSNPLVSMQGGGLTGFPIHDGLRRLSEAKRNGLTLIAVDPRRTEVAAHADVHLQLVPGTDLFLYASLLHVLFRDGLDDETFAARWVNGTDELRAAVEPFTPEVAGRICGLEPAEIETAAHLFGEADVAHAFTGTGPDMGPWSNVTEHIARALNVVCGHYPQEGAALPGYSMFGSAKATPGYVVAPDRTWEHGYQSRFGFGLLKDTLPTASLLREILEPGEDRIRALVVSAGNPANAIPDSDAAFAALSSLELLVTVDPFPTETARLADYVIAPKLHLERPDSTRSFEAMFPEPFAQYTPAIVEAPPGTIDDWEFFLRLAWAMGKAITVAGRTYEPGSPMPTTDEVLASIATRGRVSIDELRSSPSGVLVEGIEPNRVAPPPEGADARFELFPPDVADELRDAFAAVPADLDRRPFRLIVRRTKETINSLGRRIPGLPKHPFNPCFMNPDDLAGLGFVDGQLVEVASDHGAIHAVVEADATLRPGVVSMTHGFGGIPGEEDDPLRFGANPARLLSLEHETQTINAMPRMSAVPVTLAPVAV